MLVARLNPMLSFCSTMHVEARTEAEELLGVRTKRREEDKKRKNNKKKKEESSVQERGSQGHEEYEAAIPLRYERLTSNKKQHSVY